MTDNQPVDLLANVTAVQTMSLRPDDVLVVSINIRDLEHAEAVRDAVRGLFPDNRVIILSDGVEFSVIEAAAA